MPMIHLEAEVSTNELLRAAEQLSPPEFEQFVSQVLVLRARRLASPLSATEADLLLRVNQGLPPEVRRRYDELISKRRAECLTPEEYTELLSLTDRVEALEAKRAEALAKLADVRKTSLPDLINELGIPAPAHD